MKDEDYARTTTLTRLSDAGAILSRVVPEDDSEKARLRRITEELQQLQSEVFEKITKGKKESHK